MDSLCRYVRRGFIGGIREGVVFCIWEMRGLSEDKAACLAALSALLLPRVMRDWSVR